MAGRDGAGIEELALYRNSAVRRRHIGQREREALDFYLFIAPWALGFLAFVALPLLSSLFLSLTDYDIVFSPRYVGLANDGELFQDPLFYVALFNTNYLVFYVVPLTMMLAFATALLLNQGARAIGIYRTAFFLPSMVPMVASGMLWLYLLQPQWGLVNGWLISLGLPCPGWLASEVWSKPALVLLMLWNSGTTMIVYLAGLQDIPHDLREAATIDGANTWERLRYITVPLMTPTIFFSLVMNIISTFQVFSVVFVLTDGMGGPVNSTLVYLLYLYRNAFVFFRMGYASAMAWILFLIILVLTLVQFRSAPLWVYYEIER